MKKKKKVMRESTSCFVPAGIIVCVACLGEEVNVTESMSKSQCTKPLS